MEKVANYSPTETSYQPAPPASSFIQHYPDPPTSDTPRAPLPPGYYQQSESNIQQTPPQQQGSASKPNGESARSSNRLRKACDNCSIRKVKCDESGPPCKACKGLDIPCTFARPSKRRGPTNRLAESIKRQKQDQEQGLQAGPGQLSPTSPTHAAHALASFAQQPYLSPEAICPWPVLQRLLDDFFIYIHPVIPVPHEESFRESLHAREYYSNGTIVALIAAMVSCLTASFPRRARQHIKEGGLDRDFPSSKALIERCRRVGEQAHGPPTHNRLYTVKDAIISYLKGVTNVYTFEAEPGILYFKEALNIIMALGFHRTGQHRRNLNGMGPADPKLDDLDNTNLQAPEPNHVDQEMARRVFWLVFASVKTAEQLGAAPMKISIPPTTKSDPWPPYPAELDDRDIKPTHLERAYDGHVSEIKGFNINTDLFYAYDAVSRQEFLHGTYELVDWTKQKRDLVDSLKKVKDLIQALPSQFQLGESNDVPQHHSYPAPDGARSGGHPPSIDPNNYQERIDLMQNIQKANIHATQLGTRSYLVQKYFVLSDAYLARANVHSPVSVSPNLEQDSKDELGSFVKAEYMEIIRSLLQLLSTINTIYMEPNGASLIGKIRSIAMTLIEAPKRRDPVADHTQSIEYLQIFSKKLNAVQKTVLANDEDNEEPEELMLRQWADLREQQKLFVDSGAFAGLGG